ncbi:DUF6012 family protein [Pasteurella atlantica]|uniref:DUF6012 family protein n=1 Tax=Phocoenobacter atlanticus TaxID=3416742 RepID=UPI0027668A84|nr:DUF6012 family protein [Pasteurella atlantica]MDP8042524.1 DUF6012 family protein [Pasteurella atlantica]
MILLLAPRYFTKTPGISAKLVEYKIPELNISLTDNELMTKTPFPNKCYFIACKKGRKYSDGFLINIENFEADYFTIIEKWEFTDITLDIKRIVTHKVNITITDKGNNFISQNRLFSSLYPFEHKYYGKDHNFEVMTFSDTELNNLIGFFAQLGEKNEIETEADLFISYIAFREESNSYPTLEIERFNSILEHSKSTKLPSFKDMFYF